MDKVRDMATGSSGQLLKLVRVSFLRSVQFMTLVNPRYSYIFRYVQKHKGDTLVESLVRKYGGAVTHIHQIIISYKVVRGQLSEISHLECKSPRANGHDNNGTPINHMLVDSKAKYEF